MLGIVFTSLIEMLEEQVSLEFADDVIDTAALPSQGAYTAVGYYPFAEMQTLLTVLQQKTGKTVDELLHGFGVFLFHKLYATHGPVVTSKKDIIEMLDSLNDDIHVQVRKLYTDADLPEFTVLSRDVNAIQLKYHSRHELYALAEGLIDGAAEVYGNRIQRQTIKQPEPHTYVFIVEKTA